MHAPTEIEAKAKIRQIVANALGVKPPAFDGTTTLADLGADSFDLVTIAMDLEVEFGIELDDEFAEGPQSPTLESLTKMVGARRAG